MKRSFFDGRLQVHSLPTTDQPANRAEVRARIQSPRGELAVLADGISEIRHLGCLELRPQTIRGNHFHKIRHEQFYVISGEVELHAEDVLTGIREKILMTPGDMGFIDPEIAHAFLPLTAGIALEFSSETFDAKDVFPRTVLE